MPGGVDEHLYSNQGHRGRWANLGRGRLIDRRAMLQQLKKCTRYGYIIMFSLKTAVKNFSNIYGQISRKEIDFGEIIIDEKILQDNASIINYFFNLITLNPQIHIGQPFNLIFASSENQEGLVGWQEAINIENYLYIANQNDEPILISKETLEIFSLRLGSKEPKKIASSLGDFIQTLSEIMALSEKFFSKNINNDDYFILEDDEFIAELNVFFSQLN